MKYLLLLATLALSACSMPTLTQSQPAPVVIVAPAPVVTVPPVEIPPAPVIVPVSLPPVPPAPLVISDASQVTVTLSDSTLTIALAPNVSGVWLRLTLPDGTQSGITDNGPCRCLGLGGNSAHLLNVGFLAGLTVYTSPSLDGPWTVAAHTQ